MSPTSFADLMLPPPAVKSVTNGSASVWANAVVGSKANNRLAIKESRSIFFMLIPFLFFVLIELFG
jgi:hypothetical protein